MVAITTASSSATRPSRPVLVLLPPVTRPGARTYRRRRLAVLAALVVVVVVMTMAFTRGAPSAASAVQVAPAAATVVHEPAAYGSAGQPLPAGAVYVVQPGDTVWSIAHQLDPAGDTREVVDHLVSLNGTASLQPGQRLRLTGQ